MLVSGSVEHNLGPQITEDVLQALHIPDRGDDDLQIELIPVFTDQLLLHIVGIILINI